VNVSREVHTRARSTVRRWLRHDLRPLAGLFLTIRVEPLPEEITPPVTMIDASGAAADGPAPLSARRALSLETCRSCGSAAVELRVPNDAPSVYRCRRCLVQWRVALDEVAVSVG
jgi:hypothetical protein